MALLRINLAELGRAKSAAGITSDRDLADRLGMDKSTVSRIVSEKAEPGVRFITSALTCLATNFDDLFVIVPNRKDAA